MKAAADPKISAIVASHQPPDGLRRCLTALAQLDYSILRSSSLPAKTGFRP